MKLVICKKLNLPKYQQKRIKENRDLRLKEIAAKINLKSRFLFSQKFTPNFDYISEQFNPKMYIKKGIPNDVIEIEEVEAEEYKDNYYHDYESDENVLMVKNIILFKNVLEKMIINVDSDVLVKTWAALELYTLENFNLEEKVKELLEYPKDLEGTIYLALEDIYIPKNKNLFYNIDAAKEKIKSPSKDDISYKIDVLLFSFSLFFIERLHEYFLDVLKENESVNIEMEAVYLEVNKFLDIHFQPFYIPEGSFFYNTRIILDDDIINVDEKIKEIIKQFVDYVNTTTGGKYEDEEYEDEEYEDEDTDDEDSEDENIILYNIGVNSFFVYMMVYLYHILDLEKLFSDFKYPECLFLVLKEDLDYVKVSIVPEYVLQKESAVPKGSLLENIVMEKVKGKVRYFNEYLFYTGDNKFILQEGGVNEKRAIINFLHKNKERDENVASFLLFINVDEDTAKKGYFDLIAPISIESLLLFYRSFYSNEDLSIDHIYNLAHKVVYKSHWKY